MNVPWHFWMQLCAADRTSTVLPPPKLYRSSREKLARAALIPPLEVRFPPRVEWIRLGVDSYVPYDRNTIQQKKFRPRRITPPLHGERPLAPGRALKYRFNSQPIPFCGCRRFTHAHNAFQISLSAVLKVRLATACR
jgi:hypothetical protein